MKNRFRHITIMSTISILLAACSREIIIPSNGEEIPGDDCISRVELSFQTNNFSTPITRSNESESEIPSNLWVLVFKGDYYGTTFIEAAKVDYNNETAYVDLKRQQEECNLLIIAIPQDFFCLQEWSYFGFISAIDEFQTKELLSNQLMYQSMHQVCENLYTAPFSDYENGNPFRNKPLPMSCICTVESINSETKIEAFFERAVAKITIENHVTNFILEGVFSIHNIPKQGRLRNIYRSLPDVLIEKTEYHSEVGDILSAAYNQSTKDDPIYLYELEGYNSDAFLIIQGRYNGILSFYKMKLDFQIQHNYQYIIDIGRVYGIGYPSPDEAIYSEPSENIQYEITITDASGFELITNFDNYMAISNSAFIAYTDEDVNVDLFSCVTDNFNDFININSNNSSVVIENISRDDNYNYVSYLVNATIKSDIHFPDNQEYININIGDLEKQVLIMKKNPISADETVIIYAPGIGYGSDIYVDYHCLSGYVSPTTDWINLATTNWMGNKVIAGEYGEIQIHFDKNNNNEKRTGIVYLSVRVEDPFDGKFIVKRIKLSITQLAKE